MELQLLRVPPLLQLELRMALDLPGLHRAELALPEQSVREQGLLPKLGPPSKLCLVELGQPRLELRVQLELQRGMRLELRQELKLHLRSTYAR